MFLFSFFVFYSFQWSDLLNSLLRSFDGFLLSLMVKIILIELAFALLAPATDKTQFFVHLNLINDILNNLQKLHEYLNGTAIVSFFRIPFAPSPAVFSNNLAFYMKYLKLLVL